ncbi:MAG: hypothetical protein ACXW30_04165 [Micavibrio sp.]
MPEKRYIHAVAFAFCCLWLVPSAGYAAPFCIEAEGLSPECWYYDVRSCRQEAEKNGHLCTANLQEITLSDQGASFCIVDSSMVPDCTFQNSENCHQEAAKRNAVCFQSSGVEEKERDLVVPAANPFGGEIIEPLFQ